MNTDKRECLPIDQVLDTVLRVERDMTKFYAAAAESVPDEEARRLFHTLRTDMKSGTDSFVTVCESLKCGSEALADATEGDLYFLSVLVESAFYGRAGRPEELAGPGLHTGSLLANALQLERDLLLFYMKFFGISCTSHRPIFNELIQRGQRHIMELNNESRRLKARA
jgi:hypothetical protein